MATKQHSVLERGLSLTQATAINMIDMVGIGPFVTLPIIASCMNGAAGLLAWLLGALLAFMDGLVWAELGAKWPEAGGSYVFLQKLYGGKKRVFSGIMPFLFIWQTTIQAPLVIASGAIGFSEYFSYLIPITDIGKKVVSGSLVILLVLLLYRNIKSVGKISVFLWIITGVTLLWLISSGIPHFDATKAFDFHLESFKTSNLLFAALGQATLQATYSYLGYYNVCHLGAEIKNPGKNIPKSIIISIAGIAILYVGMQIVVLGSMPWQQVAASKFVVSSFFEQIYASHIIGVIATVLILLIALSALFASILGYSRIPYAAALNGDFFKIFAKVHPKHQFPYISLLAIGAVGFVFSLLLKLGDVIKAILVMRILIQFVSQATGLIIWHIQKPKDERPFKMPLFPIPAIISIIIWIFIFCTTNVRFILIALVILFSGIGAFFLKKYFERSKNVLK